MILECTPPPRRRFGLGLSGRGRDDHSWVGTVGPGRRRRRRPASERELAQDADVEFLANGEGG